MTAPDPTGLDGGLPGGSPADERVTDSSMENALPPAPDRRWWDIPAVLLLLAAVLTATIRLAATNWTDDLAIVEVVAFAGFVLGVLFGQSVFSRRIVALLTIPYGLIFVTWQLGSTLGTGILWQERVVSLAGRLGVTLLQLLQRRPVNDSILFLAAMSLLFWVLSLHAGYTLTRHAHPWLATLPTGLALFIIHIHDPYWPFRTWFLATYIFFALLLLARTSYLQRQAEWQHNQTRTPPYLGLDLIRATLLATSILDIAAWTAPALATSVPLAERAWKQVSRPWIIARSRMSNAFASLRASVGLVYDYYGDSLPLGRGNDLTDDLILRVQAPATRPENVRRFYWRARIYDNYDDGIWTSNFDTTESLTPQNFALSFPEEFSRWNATFQITPFAPLSTLFTIPQPQWVSRPVRADLAFNDDGSVDLAALHAEVNIRPGETYEIQSSISAPTELQLRNAGTDYPDWVKERYLQLPDTITTRTHQLARQLAAGHDNPYDIAVEVTNYLRDTIRYTDYIPVPPSDQDPVDWVLFDLQLGFCNYYATSEIVLLRSLGIPARWAVGYAQGELDALNQIYEVRQRDAHSWPEVYFPGFGWIEFEPTVSQPQLLRPLGLEAEDDAGSDTSSSNPADFPGQDERLQDLLGLSEGGALDADLASNRPSPVVTGLLALLGAGTLAFSIFAWQRRPLRFRTPVPLVIEAGFSRLGMSPPRLLRNWAGLARLSPVAKAYNEINRSLTRLNSHPGSHATPGERADRLGQVLPRAAGAIAALAREYQTNTYSLNSADAENAQQLARRVWQISWLERLRRLLARWQEPERS